MGAYYTASDAKRKKILITVLHEHHHLEGETGKPVDLESELRSVWEVHRPHKQQKRIQKRHGITRRDYKGLIKTLKTGGPDLHRRLWKAPMCSWESIRAHAYTELCVCSGKR